MLKIEKLKKIKSNFPVLVGSNVIPKSICKTLIKEISNSKSFDDMIMGGRSRINKGSKNFNNYIKKSKTSEELFKVFNSKSFYKKIESIFKKNFKNGSKYKRTGKAGIFAGSLELVKEGNLSIKQDNLFDDIYVREIND